MLRQIQNDLFDAGADLSTPVVENPEHPPLRITQDYIDRLEAWCDEFNEPCPPLNSFVLPGGTPLSALLHVARTVARRAERSAWAAIDAHRRIDQRAAGEVPEPAVGLAVHPVAEWPIRTVTCCGSPAAGAPAKQLRQVLRYGAPAATDVTRART